MLTLLLAAAAVLEPVAVLDVQWEDVGAMESGLDGVPFTVALRDGVVSTRRWDAAPLDPPQESRHPYTACSYCLAGADECDAPCSTWFVKEGTRREVKRVFAGFVHPWPGGVYLVARRVVVATGVTEAVLSERCDGCYQKQALARMRALGQRIALARSRRVSVTEVPENLRLRTIVDGKAGRALADALVASRLGTRLDALRCTSVPDFSTGSNRQTGYGCEPVVPLAAASALHKALNAAGAPSDSWATKTTFFVGALECDVKRGRCSFEGQ